MNNKLINIQLLRAVAIISVVLFHCTGFTAIDSGIFSATLQLGAAGVDLFFVISGFIIWHTTVKKTPSSLTFLRKRYLRILPLYWIISALLVLGLCANGQTPASHQIATSFLLLPTASYPILNVGWSLIHEMYFYSVFALLLTIKANQLRLLALWSWALLSSSYYFYFFPEHPWLQVITHPFNIEFTLGATLAYLMSESQQTSYRFWLHFLLASLITLVYWIGQFGWSFPLSIERVVLFALPICLLVLAALTSPPASGRVSHGVAALGDASYAIYLTHVPILAIINTCAAAAAIQLNALFALMICLAGGVFCYQLLERPLLSKLQSQKTRLTAARSPV